MRALQDILDQQRQEEEEHQERNQRVLGYGLAALAAVSAFPILIGQMGWAEIQATISRWPKVLQWMGTILLTLHPFLVLVATISAGAIIAFLVGLLVWTLLGGRRSRITNVQSIGKKITQAWQLAEWAHARIEQLHFPFTDRIPGKDEPEETRDLRRAVDVWDTQACELLIPALEWLENTRRRKKKPLPIFKP